MNERTHKQTNEPNIAYSHTHTAIVATDVAAIVTSQNNNNIFKHVALHGNSIIYKNPIFELVLFLS